MLSIKIWGRIRQYAANKESRLKSEKAGASIKCGWCNTWTHDVGGTMACVENTPTAQHDAFQCKQCKGWSVYFDFGMGYALVHPTPEMLEKFHTYDETSVRV